MSAKSLEVLLPGFEHYLLELLGNDDLIKPRVWKKTCVEDNQKDFKKKNDVKGISKQTHIIHSSRVFMKVHHRRCEEILPPIYAMKEKFITDALKRGFQLSSTNFMQRKVSGGRYIKVMGVQGIVVKNPVHWGLKIQMYRA